MTTATVTTIMVAIFALVENFGFSISNTWHLMPLSANRNPILKRFVDETEHENTSAPIPVK